MWGNQAAHASVAGVLPGPRFWGDIVDACELLVDHRVDNPLYDPGRGTRLPQRCRLAVCGSGGHISARIRHCPTLFGTPLLDPSPPGSSGSFSAARWVWRRIAAKIAVGIPITGNPPAQIPACPLRHGAPPSGRIDGDSLTRPRVSDFQLRPVLLGELGKSNP